MKFYFLLFNVIVILLVFNGCSFLEPSVIIVKNESDHPITIKSEEGHIKESVLEKNKGDFFMVSPGNIKLSISIDEIRYKKEYDLTVAYMEKKKIIFDLNE